MVITFTVFLLIYPNLLVFWIGGFFIVFGFILIRFKNKLGSLLYAGQVEMIKKRSSPEKMADDFRYMGSALLTIGLLVTIIRLIISFIFNN